VENTWNSKPPNQWQPLEVAEWIRNWARRNEIQDIEVAHLLYNQMSGSDLCQMQREYFTSVCPQYGNLIYESLQSLVNQFRSLGGYIPFNASVPMQSTNGHLSGCLLLNNNNSHESTPNSTLSPSPLCFPQRAEKASAYAAHNIAMGQSTTISDSHQNQMDFFPHIHPMSTLEVMPNSMFEAQTGQLNYSSPSYTSGE